MIDREKVIKGLEQFKADLKPFCGNHTDWEKFDAGLALLKEHEDSITLLKEQEAQRDYEASVEMAEYCERYEQTYNPEDGSM